LWKQWQSLTQKDKDDYRAMAATFTYRQRAADGTWRAATSLATVADDAPVQSLLAGHVIEIKRKRSRPLKMAK
jgi:hypothetical protein